MTETERVAELEAALRWLHENGVAPRRGTSLADGGCGCCVGYVDVPPNIAATLASVIPEEQP